MIFTVFLKLLKGVNVKWFSSIYIYRHERILTLSNMGKIISKNAVSFACCCCLDEATVLMLRVEGDLFGSGGNGLETTGC